MASGSVTPLYSANFFADSDPASEREMHARRLALAMDIDLSMRLLSSESQLGSSSSSSNSITNGDSTKHSWTDNAWHREGATISMCCAT